MTTPATPPPAPKPVPEPKRNWLRDAAIYAAAAYTGYKTVTVVGEAVLGDLVRRPQTGSFQGYGDLVQPKHQRRYIG